jgi:hypothetical protein
MAHKRSNPILHAMIICLSMVFTAGCAQDRGPSLLAQCQTQLDQATEDNSRLTKQLAQANQTIQNQSKQIDTLQHFGTQRTADLIHVQSLQLDRLTGGYDENHDGYEDGIVVYLQPLDQHGHIIEAAGLARVRVFELQTEPKLIGEAGFTVPELAKNWAGRLWTQHYTLRCPFAKKPTSPNITLQVEFTELLTGKTFVTEKLVTIKLPPATLPAKK